MTIAGKVSQQQDEFAYLYALTGNAYQSAIKAGYSETTALAKSSSWLEKVGIKQAIARHRVELAKSQQSIKASPDWITAQLVIEATDRGEGATHSGRVSALRTLADIHGMMSGSRADLPTELTALLAGVREGFRLGNSDNVGKQVAIEASGRVVEDAGVREVEE